MDEFERLLAHVADHLGGLSAADLRRWREFLCYIGAMIYHERQEREHRKLHDALERSIQNEELRRELVDMGKTMADVLVEKGRAEGRVEGRVEGRAEGETKAAVQTRQHTLVRQIRKRFGDVPVGVLKTVASTSDIGQLDTWLDRLVTANTIDELEIPGCSE
ncbi:MAG: hypothetical protein FJ276_37680 [Planctomycetes bacterium]|nr:hypothetical protein [Planctomycetota bacterium]